MAHLIQASFCFYGEMKETSRLLKRSPDNEMVLRSGSFLSYSTVDFNTTRKLALKQSKTPRCYVNGYTRTLDIVVEGAVLLPVSPD